MSDETKDPKETEVTGVAGCLGSLVALILMIVLFRSCDTTNSDDSYDDIPAAAVQVAKQAVKQELNYPATADFSWVTDREKFGENTYRIKGTLTAKNAFGVEQELKYTVTLTYFEGNPLDASSWNITTCNVRENY